MKRITSTLVLAAALSHTGGSALAEETRFKLPTLDAAQCKFPAYPKPALRRGEEGLVIVGVQVDESGAVLDTKILLSSGSADLDRAAQTAFRKCPHTPGTLNDRPVTMWGPVQYVWTIEPSSGKLLKGLQQAALDGNLEARYALGVMLDMPRKSEAEQAAGLKLVISAAEAGQSMAQVALASKYESGKRIPRDIAEAHLWYARAAAQGNVVAIDHLRVLGDAH
jgi:TonB family protein